MRSRPRFSSSSVAQLLVPARPRARSSALLGARTRRRTASAAQRVAWPGPALEQHRRCRSRAPPPGSRGDRAGRDGLLGEEVRACPSARRPGRRARRAARPSRRPSPPSGASWMPPANSTWQSDASARAERGRAARATIVSHSTKLDARADVAAALAALEDEPAGALLEEQPQQAGRRDVQVGRDAVRPRARAPGRAGRRRSARTAAGASRTTASCSARSSGGTKPRMPTPHGRSPSSSRGLAEQRVDLRPAHQREREERQRRRPRRPRRRTRRGR